MDEKKLEQIQKEIVQEMDKEKQIEDKIKEASKIVAFELSNKNITKANIDNTDFTFSYKIVDSYRLIKNKKINVKVIVLTVADDLKFKIAQKKYRPYFCNAEMDNTLSLNENLTAIVEAFIRHKTGRIKPEILEE